MTEAERIELAEVKVMVKAIAEGVTELKMHVAQTNGHVGDAFREINAAKTEQVKQDARIVAVEKAIDVIAKAVQRTAEFRMSLKAGAAIAVIGPAVTALFAHLAHVHF